MANLIFFKVIQQSKSSKTHRFIVQDMLNLSLVCLIFNGNMVFLTRNTKFLIFLAKFNDIGLRSGLKTIVPVINTVRPNLNDYWLSGITDAEGCFTLSLLSNSTAYRFRFILSQKWEINKCILDHFSSLFFFLVGVVSPHSKEDQWDYIVNGIKNCSYLFPYFDSHLLRTKKFKSYLF
jgi:hypothetical protein